LSAFPTRGDYERFLVAQGHSVGELAQDPALAEEVYLDWLRRGQVGCVFAQLLSRNAKRACVRTIVLPNPAGDSAAARGLAQDIDAQVDAAVQDVGIEALTILMPTITQPESLVLTIKALAEMQNWLLESVLPWRDTITMVGLRRLIKKAGQTETWAEILGLGPFPTFLPPTRQGPITSLEIRTKTDRKLKSKIHPKARTSAHLAQIPAELFIGKRDFGKLFSELTPALKMRILGGNSDDRAKASVTFALPASMWEGLSLETPQQHPVTG
jgi:hypothetical protein